MFNYLAPFTLPTDKYILLCKGYTFNDWEMFNSKAEMEARRDELKQHWKFDDKTFNETYQFFKLGEKENTWLLSENVLI